MCVIQQTAGKLQVQISFPSASLLIKQLNGRRKVILRVKSAEKKDAHQQHVLELLPELQRLTSRLTDIPTIYLKVMLQVTG